MCTMAFGNPYLPVLTQVSLPFSNPIHGEMTDGLQIQIQAVVQNRPDAAGSIIISDDNRIIEDVSVVQDRFSINLCSGPEIGGNVALHFNPRFAENCIVRNTMKNGNWGPEERDGGMPIVKGQVFEIIILVARDAYQVAVNGKHFTTYKHRMPMQNAKYLHIKGNHMKVNFIKYAGGNDLKPNFAEMEPGCGPAPAPAPGFAPPPYTPGGFVPPQATNHPSEKSGLGTQYAPQLPLKMAIPNGMHPNKMIFISGTIINDAKRFTVNLQDARDIMFHFDVRVNHNGERNIIVRNTQQGGQWGAEERPIAHFPFMPNANFDLIILATPSCYKGGFVPPQATNHPSEKSGLGSQYALQLPLKMAIPNGMHPNKMIFISGTIINDAKRFTVNLQDAHDIMFHLDARVNHNGERYVIVRNTLQGGQWGAEERPISPFPFMPNANFDLIILATPSCYKVAVNNAHFLEYAHRMPLAKADTLTISGDAKIHSLRFQ